MALTKEQIKSAALELAPADREALAEELLLSIIESAEAAWLEEARRRDGAFGRGEVGAKRVEDVIARLSGGAGA